MVRLDLTAEMCDHLRRQRQQLMIPKDVALAKLFLLDPGTLTLRNTVHDRHACLTLLPMRIAAACHVSLSCWSTALLSERLGFCLPPHDEPIRCYLGYMRSDRPLGGSKRVASDANAQRKRCLFPATNGLQTFCEGARAPSIALLTLLVVKRCVRKRIQQEAEARDGFFLAIHRL